MGSPFSSSREFKDVMDRLFTMMSEPVFARYHSMVAESYPHPVV